MAGGATDHEPHAARRSGGLNTPSFRAALPLGIGTMAAVDEIVFHQILAWHHFVDRGTPTFAILSDGLLHSAELILLVFGFFLFNRLWKAGTLDRRAAWAGFFTGLGAFQTFDGIVNHKILRLHQVRYVDTLWPYDVAWIGAGVVLLLIGFGLSRRGPLR